MNVWKFWLTIVLMNLTVMTISVSRFFPKNSQLLAQSSTNINTITESVTVQITGTKGGSGVLLEKNQNTYYILTNWHVVDQPGDYQVITPDGKSHFVYSSLIRQVPGMDLAIVPFQSLENYPLIQTGNSDKMMMGNKVYVGGWPTGGGSLRKSIFLLSSGEITNRQSPWRGYTLVYNNLVRAGMSGGPVLDETGKLIGINGVVKLQENSDKIVAVGIEINRFFQWRKTVQLPPIPTSIKPPISTDSPRPFVSPSSQKKLFSLSQELPVNSAVITGVIFSDNRLISSESNGKINLWNLVNNQLIKTWRAHKESVNGMALTSISPGESGQILATVSDDQTIKLWNLQKGELLRTFSGHKDAVASVTMTSNGEFLGSGSWDKTVKIWKIKTGELLYTLTGHTGAVNTVKISPNQEMIATGSRDGSIKLWKLKTGQLIKSFSVNSLAVLSLAFTPNGKILASGNGDGTISLWNVDEGKLIRKFTAHNDGIWSVVISGDGQTLISGSWDKMVKIWEVKTGLLKSQLVGHTGYINSLALSPDDQMIISGGWEGQIKIWRRVN